MTREELLTLCHFYHGENDCPAEYDSTPYGQLWQAERMFSCFPRFFKISANGN